MKFHFLFVVVGIMGSVAFLPNASAMADKQTTRLEPLTIKGENKEYHFLVEIADSSSERRRGLMHRENLPIDNGMIFLFDDPAPLSFWMKNTLIPLDIMFLDERGVIQHIHRNAVPHSREHIAPDDPAIAVLEINGGLSDTLGIKVGDRVVHRAFSGAQ